MQYGILGLGHFKDDTAKGGVQHFTLALFQIYLALLYLLFNSRTTRWGTPCNMNRRLNPDDRILKPLILQDIKSRVVYGVPSW